MKTLSITTKELPFPSDCVEQIYKAVEIDHITQISVDLVCYRTKDGMTHQDIVNPDGTFTTRQSAGKMSK